MLVGDTGGIPEPSTAALLATGVVGLAVRASSVAVFVILTSLALSSAELSNTDACRGITGSKAWGGEQNGFADKLLRRTAA